MATLPGEALLVDTASLAQVALPHVAIRPARGWTSLDLRELWQYRELLAFLIWRDIKVRYKQTALGAAWAILQPVFTMVVFSLFFGRLAKVPSDGVPYPNLLSLCASALAIVCLRAGGVQQQCGGERKTPERMDKVCARTEAFSHIKINKCKQDLV